MISDKKTIGLTPENRKVAEKVTHWFRDQMDAAKFAMSLAINAGVQPGQAEGTETIWNVGSFDTDREIKNLISLLFPGTTTPYRLVEFLINAGFKIISDHLAKSNDLELADLMKLTEASSVK